MANRYYSDCFMRGDKVFHEQYGYGTMFNDDDNGYTVDFDQHGRRTVGRVVHATGFNAHPPAGERVSDLDDVDARPRNPPAQEPVHRCPVCDKAAYDRDDIVRDFGIRRVWRGPTDDRHQVESHQSYCRACRVAKRREARARKRAAVTP